MTRFFVHPATPRITKGLTVVGILIKTFDDGQISVAIILNSEEPLTEFPHAPLVYKLDAQGIPGLLPPLLHSSINDRSFVIKLDNDISKHSEIPCSVLQGSTLLFLVCLSALLLSLPSSIRMYADNPAACDADNVRLQRAINKANHWKLSISADKCRSRTFGNGLGQWFFITKIGTMTRADGHKGARFRSVSHLLSSHHQQLAGKIAATVASMMGLPFQSIT